MVEATIPSIFMSSKVSIASRSLKEFSHLKNLSIKTLYRGVNELIKSQILAKSNRVGVYFINPSFVFNGDRLVFSNIIERECYLCLLNPFLFPKELFTIQFSN